MAGAGYKLFATGEVLTAASVNNYLMQQTVMVFASATARNTALSGILAEGLTCYLTDTNDFQIYDGSTWVSYGSGDITGVTAGTGLSGGGSSGSVTLSIDTATTVDKTTAQTLTNKTLTSPIISSISNTGTLTLPTSTDTLVGRATTDTLTNKTISATSNTISGVINNTLTTTTGDIIYASSANTPARLAIGSSNQVLTVSGGVPAWVTPAEGGGGKVLQVVQGTYATAVTIASSTYTDTGLTVSITPSATTSKILVLVNLSGCGISGSSTGAAGQFKLFRGTTEIQLIEMGAGWTNSTNSTNIIGSVSACYLDSPSTTSSTSYKIQIASKSGENQASMNFNYANAYGVTPKSTITVLEIGA